MRVKMENGSDKGWILPEGLESYFVTDSSAFDIDIDRLQPTRRRSEGVESAARLMAAARNGEHPKRAPITVRPDGENGFIILDGNSTYAVALASGWRQLRCKLASDDA